jgi:hypothetical protein
MSDSLYAEAIAAANQYGVPQQLFLDQINAESGFDPNVPPSATGALGLGQILPSTAANPGLSMAGIDPSGLSDPATNLAFAAQYDAALYRQTGSWEGAMEAYNQGLGNYNSGNLGGLSPAYQGLAAEGAAYDNGGAPVSGSTSLFSSEDIGSGLIGDIPSITYNPSTGAVASGEAAGSTGGSNAQGGSSGGFGFPALSSIGSAITGAVTGALPRAGFIVVGGVLLITAGLMFALSGKEGGTVVPIPL